MKLVRFLAKAFAGGRIVEAGEEVMMPDDFPMGRHTVDVAVESAALANGEQEAPLMSLPPVKDRPDAVFRTDLAHDITYSGGVPIFPTWESQRAMDAMTILSAEKHPEIDRPVLPGDRPFQNLKPKSDHLLAAPAASHDLDGVVEPAGDADASGD